MNNISTIRKDLIEKELSFVTVGVLFKVHRKLGRYCREKQYGDAIQKRLEEQKIEYSRELLLAVDGNFSNRADFLIDGKIIVEIKAKPKILYEDYRQIKRYLFSGNYPLGIIVNFSEKYLHPKRVLKPTSPRLLA